MRRVVIVLWMEKNFQYADELVPRDAPPVQDGKRHPVAGAELTRILAGQEEEDK